MRENITFLSTTLECLKASQDKNELRAILLVLIAVLTNKSTIKDGLQNLSSITKSTFESKQSSLTNLSNADFNVISNADKSSNSTQHKQVQKEIFTTIFVLCGEIFCAFREKIYAILTRGDILDCSFLYLSFITPNVLAEHFGCGCDDVVNLALDTHFRDDERFLSFVNIADKMLCLSASQSQEEWIMLVELGSISRVLAFPSAQYRLKTNKNTIKTSKIKTSPFQKTSKQTNKTNPQHIHKTKNAFVFFSAFISLSDMQSASAQKIQPFIYEAYELFKLDFGLLQEAITLAFFNADNALKRRNVCNWQLHIFWNVKHWFNSRKWLNLYGLWKTIFYERIAQARGIMDSIMQESSHYQHHFKSNAKGDLEPQPSPFSNLQPLYQAIDEVLYLQLFIYHFCGNSFVSQEQWREFNNEVLEKSSALYREFGAKFLAKSGKMDFDKSSLKSAKNIANHQLKSSKTIIGFLRDRMVENSPFKVEYSLIKNLINCAEFSQKYEIKIYCMSLIEKSENDPQIIKAFAHLGVEIIDIGLAFNSANFYNSHLQKALALREIMLKDNIEVLISPNNGYGISDFLLSVRCAPTQVFWTHGNFVYDIVGIDGRLTHICNDLGEITHEGVKFGGIPVKMDNVFYNPPVLDSQIASAREHIADLLAKQSKFVRQHKLGKNAPLLQDDLQKLRKNAVILGVMGRLTKIDSIAYLEVICEILARRKECVFVACGMGNEEVIKEKITHINAEVLDRFCFTGQIDSAVYGHIIDVWCDSFPMEQGESRIEYVAKGKGLALKLYDCDEGEFLERLEEELDSVESVISEILCEGNSSLGKGNSPAGSHCIDLAVCHEARTNSALTSCQTAKNSTSTTSLARIVGENSSDICHTEGAQATEVSQIKPSLAESSLDKNPQDSRGNLKQNDKTNSPSLAEGARGWVDSNAELSLQDSESECGKTRQSRSFFSNDSKQQKSLASKIKSELKSFFCQFLPAMLGSSTAQIASFIDTILASFLASGSISYLYYANRIFQLPLAIFAIAISTALFPMVAKSIKAKQESQVLQAMKKSFWFLCFMLLACAIGGIMLDKQIIWLLYERGKFVRSDTIECALVFCGYMIGLVPFGLARIFSLYLYATMKQALAAKISAIALGFGVVFSLIFMQFLGAFGLALAGSLSGFVLFGFTIKAFGFAKFWGIIADFKLSALLVGFIGLEVGILWILLEFVQIP